MATSIQKPIEPVPPWLDEIEESRHGLFTILRSRNRPSTRRVLFVNCYGGSEAWNKIKSGLLPPHHLWGCIELVRLGYEVAISEPLWHFDFRRNAWPHDLRFLKFARQWLRHDDILYSGHTLLYWLPLLKRIGGLKCRLVSLTYAREELDHYKAHDAVIALTPAAADQARRMSRHLKVAHLGWGVSLPFFPKLPYDPQWFLACGRTHRDHHTLQKAALQTRNRIRIVTSALPPEITWPTNVTTTTGGSADDTIPYRELLHDYYGRTTGSLIVLKSDPPEKTAVGFTNLIEALAMARPVIVTRTGALAGELDVEKAGCGLFVDANDPNALASAINELASDPARAEQMGTQGRELCEKHYNIDRFARDLDSLFKSL